MLAVPVVAFLAGGYYESTYSLLAASVWLTLAVAASLRPLPLPSPAAWLLLGLLAWTLLSALWGTASGALRVAPLVALYAGVLIAAEWTSGRRQLELLREAVLLVVLAGLVARAADAAPAQGDRLAWPVTYANGLGLLAVEGVLLAAGLARRERRASAAAALCASAAYLTYSRSALLVGCGAALLLLAIRPRSARVLAGAALGVAGVAALDAVGRTAGPALVPAVGLGALAAASLPGLDVRLPRRAALVAAAALAAGGGVLAQPLAARFAAPAPDERNAHRLLDVSGHGRTRLWRVAWDEGGNRPVIGGGAGTWPRKAIERLGVDAPANAHSLYLETFAELGVVGLLLLVGALAVALTRTREPAAVALLAGFVVHAAVDWDWQLPAVVLPALIAAGAGLRRPRRHASHVLAPAALVLGIAAAAHGIGAAILESGVDTRSRARLAAHLLPWDARPWAAIGDLRRACETDAEEPVLVRAHPSPGGCRSSGRGATLVP